MFAPPLSHPVCSDFLFFLLCIISILLCVICLLPTEYGLNFLISVGCIDFVISVGCIDFVISVGCIVFVISVGCIVFVISVGCIVFVVSVGCIVFVNCLYQFIFEERNICLGVIRCFYSCFFFLLYWRSFWNMLRLCHRFDNAIFPDFPEIFSFNLTLFSLKVI